MKKSKKILLFGNERIATATKTDALIFSYLIENYDVCGLVVSEKKDLEALEAVKFARSHNIDVYNFSKLKDNINTIKSLDADIAVLIAYGKIIPQEVIDLFPLGILNLHPSLLPKHRGPTPIESVIIEGDKETGISLMLLSKDMDSGPVFVQKKIELTGNESKQELTNKLDQLGLEALKEKFEDILNGNLLPKKQDDSKATYDRLVNKSDSVVDWNDTSEDIIRKFRAYQGWPGLKLAIGPLNVKINGLKARELSGEPGKYIVDKHSITFFTKDSSLEITELQPDGKKNMSVEEFIRGYGNRI